MKIKVEVPAVHIALADQVGLVGLIDRRLQPLAFANEFSADIDVGRVRAHGESRHQAAFDQKVRIVAHDLAVLARAGLRLVGIDDQIARPAVLGLLGHERPFEPGRKAGAAAAALARRLHFVDDPVAAFFEDRLRAVPGAARPRALEAPVVLAVEILEDAVLVSEHHVLDLSPTGGFGTAASRTLAAAPGFLASASASAAPPLPAPAPLLRAYILVSVSVVAPPMGAENWRSTCGPGFGVRP